MAARLIGVSRVTSYWTSYTSGSFTDNDSFTFRQGASEPFQQISTVKTPTQCLPLVQFPCSMIEKYVPGNAGNLLVREHHASLQTLVDQFFNGSSPTPLPHLFQYKVLCHSSTTPLRNWPCLWAPLLRLSPTPRAVRHLTIAASVSTHSTIKTRCASRLARTSSIQNASSRPSSSSEPRFSSAPFVENWYARKRSQMPSATMMIQRCDKTRCGGHDHSGSIVIEYRISGYASATTYLPETEEGRALLKRLKYAFCHGLTFKVGTPNGQPLPPLYFAITHKTSPTGGGYGFPDPTFFLTRCNQQLDQAHVPPADEIEQ